MDTDLRPNHPTGRMLLARVILVCALAAALVAPRRAGAVKDLPYRATSRLNGKGERRGIQSAEDPYCSTEVMDYLPGGSKESEPSIPYPTKCVADVIKQRRHKLAPPPPASVFLKGIPKSGTTWTEVVAKQILGLACESGLYPGCTARGCQVEDQAGEKTHGRTCQLTFPAQGNSALESRLEFSIVRKHWPDFKSVDCQLAEAETDECLDLRGAEMSSLPSMWRYQPLWMRECMASKASYDDLLSCIPSFLNASNVPEANTKTYSPKKYIFVVRDPRDVAVSWAHFRKGRKVQEPAALNKMLGSHETCKKISIWTAFLHYWHGEQLSRKFATLDLSYTNMTENTEREILRIMKFFGIRSTTEIVQKVVEQTSFKSMERMEERQELPGVNEPGSDRRKVRKGPNGSFVDEMSQEVADECAEIMRAYLPDKHRREFHIN